MLYYLCLNNLCAYVYTHICKYKLYIHKDTHLGI